MDPIDQKCSLAGNEIERGQLGKRSQMGQWISTWMQVKSRNKDKTRRGWM
jgi:hypothetical protein